MIDDRKFPLKQGDLDWLCSAYAVINLLALRKKIETPRQADDFFAMIIKKLPKRNWKLSRYITQGVDPNPDMSDLFKAAGLSKFSSIQPRDLHATVRSNQSSPGFLVYLQEKGVEEPFTHYTVVTRATRNGDFELFDSCGFKRINLSGGGYELPGRNCRIAIEAAWQIGS